MYSSCDPCQSLRRGIGVVKAYEKTALSMMNDFFNTMTPDEFAARYAPKPS
jgi:hypothetical protein